MNELCSHHYLTTAFSKQYPYIMLCFKHSLVQLHGMAVSHCRAWFLSITIIYMILQMNVQMLCTSAGSSPRLNANLKSF